MLSVWHATISALEKWDWKFTHKKLYQYWWELHYKENIQQVNIIDGFKKIKINSSLAHSQSNIFKNVKTCVFVILNMEQKCSKRLILLQILLFVLTIEN